MKASREAPYLIKAGQYLREGESQSGIFVSLCEIFWNRLLGLGHVFAPLRESIKMPRKGAKKKESWPAFAGFDRMRGMMVNEVLSSEEQARGWIGHALAPTARQWDQLDRFAAMLIAENERQNLIAASTIPSLWVRHIADSAQLLALDAKRDGLWIDLGSGPGLPGLVVAILSPRPMLLIESRRRRCEFLRGVAADLDLTHVEVVEAPLERVETQPAATISARAFAPLDRLIALSTRFSTESTRWLLPKGRNAVKELALLPQPWQRMFHVEQSRTDAESRILIGEGRIGAEQRGK
ncbi:16S rRNA (guanine(527)-N(7))-methyltransferase RsmG [Sphingopyxis sp. 550A]